MNGDKDREIQELKDQIASLEQQGEGLVAINAQLTEENSKLKESLAGGYEEKRQLIALATKDPLTGLLNSRGLQDWIGSDLSNLVPPDIEEHRKRKKAMSSSAIIFLDVDFFKELNEAHTHAGGNQILLHVAQSLREDPILNSHPLRKSDAVGRWGGDEFMIYLSGASLAEVRERLTGTDGKMRIRLPDIRIGDKVARATLSGGLVECYFNESLDEIVERASRCLYVAKGAGRNQIHAEE